MAVLDLVAAGAREVVARTLDLQARQETPSSTESTASPSSTSPTSLSSTGSAFTLTGTVASSSGPTLALPTSTGGPDKPFESHDSATSPLLFFVALGFGVVFTNLWIIVGVKYCFRYNARNRQLRMAEEGDPVALENMPRPHRRRREKKLMTMDEVNEKFPMQKYKNWVAGRAQEGLPTRGGISAPPSRANSVRSVEGVAPEPPTKERSSDEERPTTSMSTRSRPAETTVDVTMTTPTAESNGAKKSTPDGSADAGQPSTATANAPALAPATTARASLERVESEDDNDDEHINAALPPECIGTSGDACAICIETLEDDDDVRGLTCGHAFHAVCLDPWLTSRRACCPLCKADYYTPKPRPPPADGTGPNSTFNDMAQNNSRLNMPGAPQTAWVALTGRSRWFLPTRLRTSQPPNTQLQQTRTRRHRRAPGTAPAQGQTPTLATTPATPETATTSHGNFLSNLRPSLPRIRMPGLPRLGRNRQTENHGSAPATGSSEAQAVTPSQLESGNGPAPAPTSTPAAS